MSYCKKPGHFKGECPLVQKKEENKKTKKKGAAINLGI